MLQVQKPKTPKQQKESVAQLDDKQNSATPKRNSLRQKSCWEGNPEKKQKESTRKLEIEEIKDSPPNTNIKQHENKEIETDLPPSQKLE